MHSLLTSELLGCKYRDLLLFHEKCLQGDFRSAIEIGDQGINKIQPLLSLTNDYIQKLVGELMRKFIEYEASQKELFIEAPVAPFFNLLFGASKVINESFQDPGVYTYDTIEQELVNMIDASIKMVNNFKSLHEIEILKLDKYKNEFFLIDSIKQDTFLSSLLECMQNKMLNKNMIRFDKHLNTS